jgi:hypothetical protein
MIGSMPTRTIVAACALACGRKDVFVVGRQGCSFLLKVLNHPLPALVVPAFAVASAHDCLWCVGDATAGSKALVSAAREQRSDFRPEAARALTVQSARRR